MTRLSPLTFTGLGDEQTAVWEALADTRGGGVGRVARRRDAELARRLLTRQ